jgi:U3 small nucleolar RNA-associated protein 5
LPLTQQGASFLVVSEDDRTVSQYTFTSPTVAAKLSYRYASPTVSPAHSWLFRLNCSVLHFSGEISFPLPSEVDLSRPKSDSKPTTVELVEGKDERTAHIARAEFAPGSDALLCGRLAGGGRVSGTAPCTSFPEGGLRPSVVVKCDAQDLVASQAGTNGSTLQRYSAPANVVQAAGDEGEAEPAAALPTDVDMADLSLGERLLAAPVQANGEAAPSAALNGPVNAASLTRLLVQALHTSDPALLTLCLSHRDPVLIRNTVRKPLRSWPPAAQGLR